MKPWGFIQPVHSNMFVLNPHFVKLYRHRWNLCVFNPFWLGVKEDLQVLTTPFFTNNKDLFCFTFLFLFISPTLLGFYCFHRKLSCVANLHWLYISTSMSGFETATLAHRGDRSAGQQFLNVQVMYLSLFLVDEIV